MKIIFLFANLENSNLYLPDAPLLATCGLRNGLTMVFSSIEWELLLSSRNNTNMNTPITNNAEYLALFIDLLKSLDIFILYYCNHYTQFYANSMPMNCFKNYEMYLFSRVSYKWIFEQ